MHAPTPRPTFADLIRTAKALKDKAEKAADRTEQLYTSLGLTLAEAKSRMKEAPRGMTWAALVREQFDYSKARADELIRIATGITTVERVREQTRGRMEKLRANRLSRDSRN